ncbi:hypothetical protein H5410_055265 [Solanum commersonii]|uniref:Uncharacterized protein n=1 Tax=Solanum commersonii TaxID=4109 RepID=A0A9J5WH46_SOLCO|nr:hypothetical protein H5410_055265 [Solanum commersonii]
MGINICSRCCLCQKQNEDDKLFFKHSGCCLDHAKDHKGAITMLALERIPKDGKTWMVSNRWTVWKERTRVFEESTYVILTYQKLRRKYQGDNNKNQIVGLTDLKSHPANCKENHVCDFFMYGEVSKEQVGLMNKIIMNGDIYRAPSLPKDENIKETTFSPEQLKLTQICNDGSELQALTIGHIEARPEELMKRQIKKGIHHPIIEPLLGLWPEMQTLTFCHCGYPVLSKEDKPKEEALAIEHLHLPEGSLP